MSTETNPLAQIIHEALINQAIAADRLPAIDNGLPLAPWSGSFASSPFPTDAAGKPLYNSVEFADEAGLYEALNAEQDLDVLWTGALAWQWQGIDAIAQNRQTGSYVICEAKGTQGPIAASPLPYLRQTRHKGRQLSWPWCWKSLIVMAEHPATALAFLCLLEPLLHHRCERLLAVTRVERQGNSFRQLTRRLHREPDLSKYAPLALPYNLGRQQRMWADMPGQWRKLARTIAANRVEIQQSPVTLT